LPRIAVVGGTGDLGFGLALRLVKAGFEVFIGSRQAEKALKAAAQIKEILGYGGVAGVYNHEAVKNCDIVFFTIPFEAIAEIARRVASYIQAGTIVVSTIVSFQDSEKSSAEILSGNLPSNVEMVAALHTVSAQLLQEHQNPVNTDTFVFGDNPEAKRNIARILYNIEGLRPVDGGPLKNSKHAEFFTRFLVGVNKRYGVSSAGFKVSGLDDLTVSRRWGL